MKKYLIAVVAACVLVTGMISVASADVCEYYQWRPNYCVTEYTPPPRPKVEKLVLEGIEFDTGSANIRPSSYKVLDRNARMLRDRPKVDIMVVGYTDSVGGESYNQKLSERRAASVKNYMVERGVDSSRIDATGRGEMSPRADNDTAFGRQQNRRIEIEITRR
jgi:outer membrane protein OmpA-like peptidoglycan-associated protein